MPKRTDIHRILIIGAGPIVIGQACEFDYSGTQACKALREEGFQVILVNSNPATIMTDPDMADMTYIEPIQWEIVEKIIIKEKPDALLPTMGGQTALNCALDLVKHGVLETYGVQLIGASHQAIDTAEDRELFKKAMEDIGLSSARSSLVHSMEEAHQVQAATGFPCIIRPSFTMGGSGGGIAYNREEFEAICSRGLDASPTHELLIEESLIGWKEFEMEVVRDGHDNVIIVCSIENIDPMGVHTGDSITVAPAITLTDKEYQIMRNAAIAVLRRVGVETGGSNVQFAIHPKDGRMIVIEMNPRVSRSSALASKATGFPIAKIAAKLAVGYTLDELSNDITGGHTPASFEPTIDYIVTKIPRFAFEKFTEADDRLTTQMKSVGEAMAIGRTFAESLQKALRSLETGLSGFNTQTDQIEKIRHELCTPGQNRILYVADAFRMGMTVEDIYQLSNIDPWFLAQIEVIVREEQYVTGQSFDTLTRSQWLHLKKMGFSDMRLAELMNCTEQEVRTQRWALDVRPVYKRVDTCAAEFSTSTAYQYSSYDEVCEANPSNRKKIMVLGGGPNRIGQGIEFDYCCVHASLALQQDGFETIMVNCNPETVSTDYDTSDRLYFEPLTLEDVLEIVNKEKPMGVIVQFGGQTPLKLALDLESVGVPIIGTSPTMIDMAEDRERFQKLVKTLNLQQPDNRFAYTPEQALCLAQEIGYPVVVRPSYVLGGRAMQIVHQKEELRYYMQHAVSVSPTNPILLDHFLSDAMEVDVDALCDGKQVVIAGIMQHIEQAGVHSGDSACALPPFSISETMQQKIRDQTISMAQALKVIGLMNVQFAIQGDQGEDEEAPIYILEVNPRASRTVPFVAKATGYPIASIAARCMAGKSLSDQNIHDIQTPPYISVKEVVFPFVKFPGVDLMLGPEMKSTGEVMGIARTFPEAYLKAQISASIRLPLTGKVFVSVRDEDKAKMLQPIQKLLGCGFHIIATRGTSQYLKTQGLKSTEVNKVTEGRPHIVDMIKNGEIAMVFNTVDDKPATIADSRSIRTTSIVYNIPIFTTAEGVNATCEAIIHLKNNQLEVRALQHLQADQASIS